jgi:hypothetical protein
MLLIEIQTTKAEQLRQWMQWPYTQSIHQEGGSHTLELLRHHFEANWLLVEDLRGELGFRQLWTHLRTHRHPKTPYNGSEAYIWRWLSLLVHDLGFRVTTIKMMGHVKATCALFFYPFSWMFHSYLAVNRPTSWTIEPSDIQHNTHGHLRIAFI